MTHESDKNIFRDARSQIKNIEKALGEIDEGYAMNTPEIHGHLGQNIRIAVAALRDLDMSVREIVDKNNEGWKAFRDMSVLACELSVRCGLRPPDDKAAMEVVDTYLTNSKSFFEGTERDTLEQEQAETEQRYYKDRRIDALCDADNAKDEEFCGPDGEGEPE